jgi:DNA-binding beta-propeller fold protein YncE
MKLKRFPLIAAALVLIASTASLRAEFLYVSYGKGLLSFSIDQNTGVLTNLPGTPTLFSEGTGSLALDRMGRFLYLSTGSTIHGYRITSNGQLIGLPGSPYNVAGGFLAVDPFNRFLYSANDGTVAVYRIELNGSLVSVPGSPFTTIGGSSSIAVDPFGRFLYIASYANKAVSVYSVLGNGALRQVAGSPFSNGRYNVSIVTEFTGRFIYVASDLDITVTAYKVAPNGALSQGTPSLVGTPWCEQLGYNPRGGYLYLLSDTAGLNAYHINPVTGLPEALGLYFLGGATFAENNPVGIAVTPDGKFVYEGNSNSIENPYPMTLRGFKVGPTGILTLVPGSPYFPLGTFNGSDSSHPIDPALEKTLGWPSSMVVAP